MKNSKEWLTQEEAAERLHTNRNTIAMLREEKILQPCVKIGKHYLISSTAIESLDNYDGLDLSNRSKARKSFFLISQKKDKDV